MTDLRTFCGELIDNAVDEAAAGFCDKIDVVLHRDGSMEVMDNGRGIPVGKHKKRSVSALEVLSLIHI